MKLIQNNPFRIVGLLVGATAREQNRQVNRLKQFLEAGQAPDDDFSFPALGKISRTVDSVTDAASKLNLDSDKINAALFWFYNGNPITDEPAFEALKKGDLDQAVNIWSKLISTADITPKNASAYNNLSTLYLCDILESKNANEALLEQGILLKLKFLESDFIKAFKALATDETFKTTKKELQHKFLNAVLDEIQSGKTKLTLNKFIGILNQYDFSAKTDFLKSIAQKLTSNITAQIETARRSRTANKANAATAGEKFYKNTKNDLAQLKEIFGAEDFSYSNVADKVANELLQCSIHFFNHSQEKNLDNNYHENALNLVKAAQAIAIGSAVKDIAKKNLQTLEEMEDREVLQAIEILKDIKSTYLNINYRMTFISQGKRIDENKILLILKKYITEAVIEKIVYCDNEKQVKEFYDLVDFLISAIKEYYCKYYLIEVEKKLLKNPYLKDLILKRKKEIKEKKKKKRWENILSVIKMSPATILIILMTILKTLTLPIAILAGISYESWWVFLGCIIAGLILTALGNVIDKKL